MISNRPRPRALAVSGVAARDPVIYEALRGVIDTVNGWIAGRPTGRETLVAGTVTVKTSRIRPESVIVSAYETIVGTPGYLSSPQASRVAGRSFVINSTSATDTSTVVWKIED